MGSNNGMPKNENTDLLFGVIVLGIWLTFGWFAIQSSEGIFVFLLLTTYWFLFNG